MKRVPGKILIILFICALAGCFGAGTLGGFPSISFPTSKQNLSLAIEKLYSDYPGYRIPEKWQTFDDWKRRGYDFLDSRIFYFSAAPEEMYYVSFIGNPDDAVQIKSNAKISIRAVNNGTGKWALEADMSATEKKRIRQRFQTEIISRLEQYTQTTSVQ